MHHDRPLKPTEKQPSRLLRRRGDKISQIMPVCMLEAIPLLNFLSWDNSWILCNKSILLLSNMLGLTSWHMNHVIIKERIQAIWENKTITGFDTYVICRKPWEYTAPYPKRKIRKKSKSSMEEMVTVMGWRPGAGHGSKFNPHRKGN